MTPTLCPRSDDEECFAGAANHHTGSHWHNILTDAATIHSRLFLRVMGIAIILSAIMMFMTINITRSVAVWKKMVKHCPCDNRHVVACRLKMVILKGAFVAQKPLFDRTFMQRIPSMILKKTVPFKPWKKKKIAMENQVCLSNMKRVNSMVMVMWNMVLPLSHCINLARKVTTSEK